jgi:MoxR-like ATPase
MATQNPTGAAGTQLLPDSQMDRFYVRLSVGYPAANDEVAMVMNRQNGNPLDGISPLISREELVAIQETVAATYIKESVVRYIVNLIGATRNHPLIARGASPRATLAVASMSKAIARLSGRDYVTPGDVQTVFVATVAHRISLSGTAESRNMTAEQALQTVLEAVKAPHLH